MSRSQRTIRTVRAGRRAVVAHVPGVLATLAAACAPGTGLPRLTTGPNVVRVATFLSQASNISFGDEQAPAELQRAANAVNQQQVGLDIRVDFLPLPAPAPAAGASESSGSAGGAGGVASGASATPSPVTPTVAALEQAASEGGTPPDLVLLTRMGELQALLERQLIREAEEVAKTDGGLKAEEFATGALETVRSRGRIAVLPLLASAYTLFCDRTLFAAADVATPGGDWTWNTLVETGRRLTRPGGDQWAINAHSTHLLLSLIWGAGGDVLSKDGKRTLLTAPAAREGIQFWADLALRHRIAPKPPPGGQLRVSLSPNELAVLVPGSPGSDSGGAAGPPSAQPGERQRVAMLLNSGVPSVAFAAAPGASTLVAADVPKGPKGGRATWTSVSAALAVGAHTQDARAAWRAARVLADQLRELPVSRFGFPVQRVDPLLLRRVRPQLSEEEAEVLASALGYSRGLPPELARPITAALSNQIMTPVLAEQTTVEHATSDAAAVLDELLRA